MSAKITIAGHGLAGSIMAMTCYRNEIPFQWYGMSLPGEASFISSGLITPVTGRRYVKSWMIDELMVSAIDFYLYTEQLLEKKYFEPVEILRFLNNDEAIKAWEKRKAQPEYDPYISKRQIESLELESRSYGILKGSYKLDTPGWLRDVRSFFSEKGFFHEGMIDEADGYEVLISATGSFPKTSWPGMIPNKGEALIVTLPEWKYDLILKDEIYIVPWGEEHTYWIGSYYEPWPETPNPTTEGKQRILKKLQSIYQGPFIIQNHVAGIRPTMKDRRPLVGPYSSRSGCFLFNGMGTKGTSLAPYWAKQLLDHIISGVELPEEVLPSRF